MSLKSFIKDSVDVRERFRAEFTVPPLGTVKELEAPPLTKNHSGVGTAFDYLLRFYVARLNPKSKTGEWIAEASALCDIEFDGCTVSLPDLVEKAKASYSDYMRSGRVDDELLRAVLTLAQLDVVHRRGLLYGGDDSYFKTIGKTDPKDVEDLRRLISLVNPELFRAERLCLLNPRFGRASELVGGADCDIVIDDTLIDIKTVKDFQVKREYFDQLIGYYVLFKIGGIEGLPKTNLINRLGIYFSRHGYLWLFNVKDFVKEKQFSSFVDWFKKRAKQEV